MTGKSVSGRSSITQKAGIDTRARVVAYCHQVAKPVPLATLINIMSITSNEIHTPTIPALITVAEAAEICRVRDQNIIRELHRTCPTFPSVQLGRRTIRIDRDKLTAWLANGGVREVSL